MDDLDLGATIKGFNAGQKIFGRYTLKNILGRGGMGVVWLARDEELERDVALKFLPEVVAMDKEAVRDLKRETRRSLELTHSHIVRIYDFIQDVRTAAISMEYIAGDTVAARKVDHPAGHFETAEIETWMRQLLEALSYAHTKGEIVHRDLKPANLMVDARGDLKIADFGIAASVSDSVSRISAQAGSSGTPVYMSPQQMMGDKPAVTDDIYAFGATVYELLTGKPPFHSGNVLMQVQNKVPATMAARRQELATTGAPIPASWEETIAACLAKEPGARPQSAREVARRLGLGTSVTSAPFTVQPTAAPASLPPTERVTSPAKAVAPMAVRSRKTGLYAGLAVATLALSGLGYYTGVYAPEQKRRSEQQRLEEQGRAAEAALLRTEKAKQDALAKDKADAEQQAYAVMVARIDALLDGTSVNQREATEQALKEYRVTMPARFKTDIEGRWVKRVASWEAHRLSLARGGLRVRTNPEGAEVQIGSLALEKSPVVKNEVRLGKYPVIVRADGYEEYRVEIEVKENDFADPGLITLVRSVGALRITSVPSGLTVSLDGKTGTTPLELKDVPVGPHQIKIQRPGWPAMSKDVTVTRNELVQVPLELAGGAVEISSTPSGAEVWSEGVRLGVTPLRLQDRPPGITAMELRKPGFGTVKRTVEFVPGRTADRWDATLKPIDSLAGRPDFQDGPKTMRIRMQSNTTGAAKVNTMQESDWEFGAARVGGGWDKITERIVASSSSVGDQYGYTPGTTFQYTQAASGAWTGVTVRGGWSNGMWKPSEYDKYLFPFIATVWVMSKGFWPTTDVREGGTWPVPIPDRLDFLGGPADPSGLITGHLKKLSESQATIEYSFTISARNLTANKVFSYTGTLQIRVNLRGKYVEWGLAEFTQTDGGSMSFKNRIESEVLSVAAP